MQGTSQGPDSHGSLLVAMPHVPRIIVAQETRCERRILNLELTTPLCLRPPGQAL